MIALPFAVCRAMVCRPFASLGLMMKTDTPRPIRLEDYRPSSYLIDTVLLDVSLDPTRTRVRARLTVRAIPLRRPSGRAPATRWRDCGRPGEPAPDGRGFGPREHEVTDDKALTIPKVPADPFTLEIETFCNPEANKALSGLYRSRGIYCTQCEAGRLPPHHLFPRPAGRARRLHRAASRPTSSEAPVLLANGNPVERGTLDRGRPPLRRLARSAPQAQLSVRAGRRRSRARSRRRFTTMSGRKVDLGIYVEPGKEDRCALGDGLAQALHALGRGALRPRVRSRRLQHRRRVRLQHGRDGEQGPQHLQRQAGAGLARNRDRRRLSSASRASSRTSTSTTGPATASPAATGSSSA